jgi:hypothetical protein
METLLVSCSACGGPVPEGKKTKRPRKYCNPCYQIAIVRMARENGQKATNPRLLDPEVIGYVRDNYNPKQFGSLAKVARELGIYAEGVVSIAKKLGMEVRTKRKLKWTPEEDEFILEYGYSKSWEWMAKRMKTRFGIERAPMNILHRAMRIGASLERVRDFYNPTDVAAILGVHPDTARALMESGQISSYYRASGKMKYWRCQENDILQYVMDNQGTDKVRGVDKIWLLDVTSGGVLTRRALREAGRANEKLEARG